MLKRFCSGQQEEDYQFLRDKAVASNRKHRRQDLFQKYRTNQLANEEEVPPSDNTEHEAQPKIVDAQLQSQIREILLKKVEESDIPRLLECIEQEDAYSILEGAIGIRKLLSAKSPPTWQLVEQKAHIPLLALTKHSSPQIRLQAWWCLSNIAFGSDGECSILMDNGIFPSFSRCLSESNAYLVEQGVWGISNLACDSIALRDRLLREGAMRQLITTMNKFEDEHLTEMITWAMCNLCVGKPLPSYDLVEEGILFFCCLIDADCTNDEKSLLNILRAVSKHCVAEQLSKQAITTLLETQFVLKVIAYIAHTNIAIANQSLIILGNLLTGREEVIDLLLKLKILEHLEKCLAHKQMQIRSSACWALCNIAESSTRHVEQLLSQKQMIKTLLMLLIEDTAVVKCQIVWFFTQLGSLENFQAEEFYVKQEVIVALVELLKDEDEEIVLRGLMSLFNILQRADDRDKAEIITNQLDRNNGCVLLRRLQFSESNRIVYENNKIVSRFFDQETINSLSV